MSDWLECFSCGGRGYRHDGRVCTTCGGTGLESPGDKAKRDAATIAFSLIIVALIKVIIRSLEIALAKLLKGLKKSISDETARSLSRATLAVIGIIAVIGLIAYEVYSGLSPLGSGVQAMLLVFLLLIPALIIWLIFFVAKSIRVDGSEEIDIARKDLSTVHTEVRNSEREMTERELFDEVFRLKKTTDSVIVYLAFEQGTVDSALIDRLVLDWRRRQHIKDGNFNFPGDYDDSSLTQLLNDLLSKADVITVAVRSRGVEHIKRTRLVRSGQQATSSVDMSARSPMVDPCIQDNDSLST